LYLWSFEAQHQNGFKSRARGIQTFRSVSHTVYGWQVGRHAGRHCPAVMLCPVTAPAVCVPVITTCNSPHNS